MHSSVFDDRKGRHTWPQETICEMHRRLYDCLVLQQYERMLPILEEAYVMGIKMTKKLVDYKLDLPQWKDNTDPEANRLRRLRVQLTEKLDEAGCCV